MNPQHIAPALVGALVISGAYRGIRRNIGRQRVQVRRTIIRIAAFTLLGALAAFSMARQTSMLAALLAGVAGGALLGLLGLRNTRFETTSEGRFYTPHTYFGVAVTALFMARLLYRVLWLDHGILAATPRDPFPLQVHHQSAMTLAMFGAVVGYYVLFYAGVLRKTRERGIPQPD